MVHAAGVDDPAAKQAIADALTVREPVDVTARHAHATPEEIADIAHFLAGPKATNLVGAVLLANGGRFTA